MINKLFENERRSTTSVKPSRMRIVAYATGAKLRLTERRMLLSNKKLTTEEKIEKSKQITEEISRIEKRLKERRDAQKKLDAEIAEELDKEYLVNMQALGKDTAERIGEGFTLEEYITIMKYIFMLDEVIDFVESERAKKKQEAEKSNSDECDTNDSEEIDNTAEIPA